MDDDRLYLNGLPLDEDFIVKAQLRVPVRDFAHPVAAHLFIEMRDRYLRHLSTLEEGIADVLERAREVDKSLVFAFESERSDVLMKAGAPGAPPKPPKTPGLTPPKATAAAAQKKREEVKQPGSRGGKFYRTKSGKIVYGTQPPPGHDESHVATDEEIAEHVAKNLSPSIFLGHDEETMEALRESGEFDEQDIEEIEIVRNNLFKPELEDQGINEHEIDAETQVKNAFGQQGHHMAVVEWMKRFFVENVVEADPENNKEEDVLERWEELHQKYQKAVHNPAVQAALKQRALEHEEQVNKYNFDIENTREDTDPLFQDFVHGENAQDVALGAILGMRDLGVLFIPRKGQIKRRSKKETQGSLHLKGTMQPDTEYLSSLSASSDKERGQARVNLARMNEAQLGSLYIAAVMASTRHSNGDFDEKDAWNDEQRSASAPTIAEKLIKDALTKKLNTTPTEVNHVFSRLNEIGATVAASANKFNSGENVGLRKMFSEEAGVTKIKDVKELRAELMKEQAERDRILKSQENESFTLSTQMKGGFWDKPLKGGAVPTPFTWQAQGINWVSTTKRGILGFDMGMGKTATMIGATCQLIDEGKIERNILILPPTLMAQWPNEIRTYAPGIKADEILDLSPYSLEERKLMLKSDLAKRAKFIILSSGTLTEPKEGIAGQAAEDEGMDNEFVEALNELPNSMVTVDEVHAGGYKSGAEKIEQASVRHRLMRMILKDRDYAVGMTGTPVPNSPLDLYNLVDLFVPGKAGDRDQWMGTLANTIYDEETGARTVANPEKMTELRKRLRPWVFAKEVDDEDVAPQLKKWLPSAPVQARHELIPDTRHGENGLSQRDYFMPGGGIDRIAEARVRIIEDKWKRQEKEMSENQRALITRLIKVTLQRQASISPALIDPTYGLDAPAPKLDLAINEIKQHFNGGWGKGGEPITVFAASVKAFDFLKRRLKQAGVDIDNQVATISQEASAEERNYIQDAVNAGKIKIVMIGIKSGGAGLNLQKASNHMIFLDNPWTPAEKSQAIRRVQRPQQEKTVRITSMSMMGTYDPLIEEKIANKQVVSDALLGDDATWEDDANEKIKALLGGVSPGEYKRRTKKQYTEEHDRNFADIAAAMRSGDDLSSVLLADRNLTDVELNQEARKELGPHLTAEFDMAKDRKKWREKRAMESMQSRIAGVEALIKVMTKELDKTDPEVKTKIERLKGRLAWLKEATTKPYMPPTPKEKLGRTPTVHEKVAREKPKTKKPTKKPVKKSRGAA